MVIEGEGMDCYTGLIEEFRSKYPDATPEQVDAYVDNYRAAEAEAEARGAEARQAGDRG